MGETGGGEYMSEAEEPIWKRGKKHEFGPDPEPEEAMYVRKPMTRVEAGNIQLDFCAAMCTPFPTRLLLAEDKYGVGYTIVMPVEALKDLLPSPIEPIATATKAKPDEEPKRKGMRS